MTRRPHRTRRGLAAILGLASALAPFAAHADKFDETLDFSMHARASTFRRDGVRLRSGHGGAPLPNDARLVGRANALAPMLRANLSLHGWRFGVGAGFEGYSGLRIRHDATPGVDVTDGYVWGIPVEGFVGYALTHGGPVRPFVEARVAATFFGARAGLQHRDGSATELLRMRAAAVGVGARIGIVAQLNEYFFLDVGLGRVFRGTGAWTACIGLGIPIPLSNL